MTCKTQAVLFARKKCLDPGFELYLQSLQQYGLFRIFTENTIYYGYKMQNTDSQDSSPPILMNIVYYRITMYGKNTKNTQIVSATVRKK